MKKENILEEEKSLNNKKEETQKQVTPTHSNNSTPIMEQPSVSVSKPPLPERLKIDEGVEKQILLLD